MNLNLLDRAVQAVAPVWAADRAHAKLKLQALSGASDVLSFNADSGDAQPTHSFGRRWFSRPSDAKADTLRVLPGQRGHSRELARTSPIAVGAIRTNVDRVVGTGIALSCQPDASVLRWTEAKASDWKKKVQAEFSLWSDSKESDICQTLNFYEQQALVLRSMLESGDCFTILPDGDRTTTMPYALRVQIIEADRVGNDKNGLDSKDVSAGVKTNASGAPVAYHVYDQHPGAMYSLGNTAAAYQGQFIQAIGATGRKRMLHHFNKLRPDQPRGVPYLAPIVEIIKQIKRYTDAEIEAAVISAYFTVFIEGAPGGNLAPVFDGGASGAGVGNQDIELGMGAVVGLAPGEKANMANPGRPNPNFDAFTVAMLRQVGMALGMPVELLIKQFNSSYSASKAALLDAWIYFRGVRTWLSRSFCQPVYETWLAEAVAIGRIEAPGFFTDPLLRWAYTRAAWHGDSMGSINPKDEVAAYTSAIDARLMTRERAVWELFGSDFTTDFPQMRHENELLTAADMLPVPKAGAAAPQSAQPSPNKDTTQP